jgi:membrane dipeptidase
VKPSRVLSPVVFGIVCLTVGCSGEPPGPAGDEADPSSRARQLARELIIVDTHVDLPYRLNKNPDDISVRTEGGHFDYPRAKEGGLDAPFMSIYVPASLQETGGSKELADELIDMVEKLEADWPDKFAVARSPDDVRRHFESGLISLPMGMENGSPVEGDLDNLRHFHDRGIRYITLTHSENNEICDSSYAEDRKWEGLSPFGKEVVAEMNRLGIMVDVSHVSDRSFYDVLEITRAPVIASHSSCRRFTPEWERNMDDEMIRALAENGGVMQINFGSMFVREDAYKQSTDFWKEFREYMEANGLDWDHEDSKRFRDEYWKDRERIRGDLSDIVAQIDHVVELAGIDHVGFGSDFDGVASLPVGLDDVSHYPDLIEALLEAGYTEEEIEKIAGGNLLRVWTEVERVAEELRQKG